MASYIFIVPTADKAATNSALDSAGYGPSNLSVELFTAEVSTHWGCFARLTAAQLVDWQAAMPASATEMAVADSPSAFHAAAANNGLAVSGRVADLVEIYETVAEMLAATPSNNTIAFIDGDLFRYDAGSEDFPDQLETLIATAHTEEATESHDLSSTKTLANTPVIFGTVTLIDTVDGTYTCTDTILHKHRIGTNQAPYINHETGSVSLKNRIFDITYRYASAPGRWKRMLKPTTPVSPYMLGAIGSGDETDLVAWSLLKANALGRNVFIDREYFYTRHLQLYSNQLLYGRGREKAGLSCLGDAVMDRYRTDLDNVDPSTGVDTSLHSQIGTAQPSISPKSGSDSFRIRDLQMKGNILDFDWATHEDSLAGAQNAWQNSPQYCGITATEQNGCVVLGLKCEVENVWIHGYGASLMLFSNAIDNNSFARNPKLGNCLGQRFWYGWSGYVQNYHAHGYFRYDLGRWYNPLHCHGLLYRDDWQATWPAWEDVVGDDRDGNAMQMASGTGGTVNNDIRSGRKAGPFVIHGLDVDFNTALNSVMTYLLSMRQENEVIGVCRHLLPGASSPNYTGAIERVVWDLLTVDSQLPNKGVTASGYVASHHQEMVNIQRTRAVPAGDGSFDWGNSSNWFSVVSFAPAIGIGKNSFGVDEFVRWNKRELQCDYPVDHVVRIPSIRDTAAEDIYPSQMVLSGHINNRFPRFFMPDNNLTVQVADLAEYATFETYPVRVYLDRLTFNVITPPGGTWKNTYFEELRIIKMRGCRTHDGMVSEQEGEAEWVAGAIVSVATNLLWKAREVCITPITPKAVEYLNGYEWADIEDEGTADEDARRPTLQINLNTTPDPADDVRFSWACAVSPC